MTSASTTPAQRLKHVQDLMNVIRGQVKYIVFIHDASRIVQTAVKYRGQKERDEIAVELKGKYKELAQNKYSRVRSQTAFVLSFSSPDAKNFQFLVTKLVRLCLAHRASILLVRLRQISTSRYTQSQTKNRSTT
jgi:pumilio family protein 6